MSAIEKSGADWTDGKAIFYALNLDVYAKSTADWLLAFPELMVLLTHGTWYLELFAGFIIFVPYFNTQLRIFTILLFIGFHLSLYFFLVLGLFPWVMMAGWLGYIPTKVWDGLLNKVDKGLEPIQVFVNPQNTAVKKVLLVFITMMGVRKVSLEEDQDMTTVNWCVSDHQKKVYGKDAYKKLISRSFYYLILPEFLKLSVLKSLMLGMYNRSFKSIALIKSKFLWYSKYSSIYGVSYNIIGGVFLFLALFSAAQKAGATKALDLNGNKVATHMNTMINYSHIYQYWGMFAPNVPKSSGWYVLPAVLKDGTELDMLTGEKVTYEKPSLPANQYTNDRHRNYMSNKMRSKKFKKLRRRFVEVLAENWNEKQSSEDKELKEFKLMFMLENTEPHKQTLLQLARYELRNGDPLIIISKKY